MDWFQVDRKGLASILERKGKSFALLELIQNAWDSGTDRVRVQADPMAGEPYVRVAVEDWGEGFSDLAESHTMFGRSRRAVDPEKRGRFSLGEKLVLSISRTARITSTTGSVNFGETVRRSSECREQGTLFEAEIRMTRDELADCLEAANRLIPPQTVTTEINGGKIGRPRLLTTFTAKLPTEIADADSAIRRTIRSTSVEAFAVGEGEIGDILEMGIPVCTSDCPWRLNVGQKIPLGLERDSVTDAFRRALLTAATNALAKTLTADQAAQPWASEAMGDSRATADTVKTLVQLRFGDRAVVAVPGDPVANATAEAVGCNVIHGGALSSDAWANVRKHAVLPSSSQAFPTPKPKADGTPIEICPLCKQPIER